MASHGWKLDECDSVRELIYVLWRSHASCDFFADY